MPDFPDFEVTDVARDKLSVREFFHVAKLIPERQDIVSVAPGTVVRVALELMRTHGFSQLPVMIRGTTIGVFSYRSLAHGLDMVRRNDDPLDCLVEDFVEDIAYVRASDEVGAVLRDLDRDGAVLIGDESNLVAVATATDVVSFLWEATRPFVLLQDIELACRDLMTIACPARDEITACISMALPEALRGDRSGLRDLTMGELLSVLTNRTNFRSSFSRTFGNNRDLVCSVLDPVLGIRNKVFHFREDVTVEDLETLVSARRWLRRKAIMASEQ